MIQGLLRSDPSKLIIDKYLLEQIDAVLSHAAIVVLIQVAAQALPISILDHLVHAFGHLKLVDTHIVVQCLRAKRLNYPDYLPVLNISAPHEFVHFKKPGGDHAAYRPHIARVVVLFILEK